MKKLVIKVTCPNEKDWPEMEVSFPELQPGIFAVPQLVCTECGMTLWEVSRTVER